MKKILITGGAGFIGSNFIKFFLKKYSEYKVINIDKLTYAADENNLVEVQKNKNYEFIKGDIANSEFVSSIFENNEIHGVINFAAESHVDNSIKNPNIFIQSNINGTFNLLNTSFKSWMLGPSECKSHHNNSRFLHVSTDEVYGSLGKDGFFSEKSPYSPNSPYSASKASSDMIVRSYFKTYDFNSIITNCSNNYGPKQHGEKLIPTIIRNAIQNKPIPIYGSGDNIRDWLYVEDHCKAIDLAFHFGNKGEQYNIGGDYEKTNLNIARDICILLDEAKPKNDSYVEQIQFVEDRAGHDFRYAVDSSKIKNELGWKPEESFESGINKTIEWYLDKYSN
jgi:dTDP-glucose 4,6-dehydratase